MRLCTIALISACAFATVLSPVRASATTRRAASHRRTTHTATRRRRAKPVLGQRTIEDGRATEIQEALIKSGYLTTSSGHWDAETESAMSRFQADNGWQTKWVPDSRAIIKLGLGPKTDSAASLYSPPLISPRQGGFNSATPTASNGYTAPVVSVPRSASPSTSASYAAAPYTVRPATPAPAPSQAAITSSGSSTQLE